MVNGKSENTNGRSPKTISPQGQYFLKLLAEGVPQYKAATMAWKGGYARQKRYLKNPEIVAAMEEIFKKIMEETRVTREEVVEGLLQAVNHAQLQGDASGQVKAWTELAKLHGFYEPETIVHQHEHKLVQDDLSAMSDAELLTVTGSDPITLSEADYEIVDVEKPAA